MLNAVARAVVLALISAAAAAAQTADACTYARCALGIAPRLTSLTVVRGDAQVQAGSLSFLWPRAEVLDAFAADTIAARMARQSLRTRHGAALFTDLGVVLLAGSAIHAAAANGHARANTAVAGAGAVLLGISIPIQFAADAQLSRAVYEFNRRFSR